MSVSHAHISIKFTFTWKEIRKCLNISCWIFSHKNSLKSSSAVVFSHDTYNRSGSKEFVFTIYSDSCSGSAYVGWLGISQERKHDLLDVNERVVAELLQKYLIRFYQGSIRWRPDFESITYTTTCTNLFVLSNNRFG